MSAHTAAQDVRTVVVDDDFRVAAIHAASVDRLDGFVCVGQAHTASEASALISSTAPDLLLLDIYLPDRSGLDLFRSLRSDRMSPDCIFITAARDLDSVRTAIGLGAVHYLVKPFGFQQLRSKLEDYLRWRTELARASLDPETDQAMVDALYDARRGSADPDADSGLPPTMAAILDVVQHATEPVSAMAVAEGVGISRPTAQRYLSELHRRGMVELDLRYGQAGRPVNRYRLAKP